MTDNFEQIYNEHVKRVYNLALQYVQNTEDAQEIAQDVFIAVYQQLDSFRSEANLSTWIYRIAVNKSLDFIKAKKRKKRFGLFSIFTTANEPAHFEHPGVLLEYQEETKILFEHINDLPENQKTVLILQKIEGKTMHEISEILEISPKAVESLLQRAKTNLLKKINYAKEDN
jgi:RNA polymerase sigma-70 factor (ECF subfamily)